MTEKHFFAKMVNTIFFMNLSFLRKTNVTTRFSVVELVLGPTFNALVPFFEKCRILLTTRLSMAWGSSEQNGQHHDNPHGHISTNSIFRQSQPISSKLPGTPLIRKIEKILNLRVAGRKYSRFQIMNLKIQFLKSVLK